MTHVSLYARESDPDPFYSFWCESYPAFHKGDEIQVNVVNDDKNNYDVEEQSGRYLIGKVIHYCSTTYRGSVKEDQSIVLIVTHIR